MKKSKIIASLESRLTIEKQERVLLRISRGTLLEGARALYADLVERSTNHLRLFSRTGDRMPQAFHYVRFQSLADGSVYYLRHVGPERTLVAKGGANRFGIDKATQLAKSLNESKQYIDYRIDTEPVG